VFGLILCVYALHCKRERGCLSEKFSRVDFMLTFDVGHYMFDFKSSSKFSMRWQRQAQ
jgi:hypothetical protein